MQVESQEIERALIKMRERAEKMKRRVAGHDFDALEAEMVGIEWAARVLERAIDRKPKVIRRQAVHFHNVKLGAKS